VINAAIYGAVLYFSFSFLSGWLDSITEDYLSSGIWTEIIKLWLKLIALIVILFICYLLFTIFGGIISAPFNEKISQFIEKIITGKTINTGLAFWDDVKSSIKAEIQKILFYLPFILLLLLMNFIPVIGNFLSVTLGFVFSAYYNSLDFLDYPMTRRMITFRDKLKMINRELYLTFGFGSVAFVFMFLPVINVFTKPILVVAGTSLYFEKNYSL
jgi:uncharacterized protein involved in cysteine biosynthesis